MSFHTFRASVDGVRCLFCNLPESEHECSVCNTAALPLQKMAGMLYCEPCLTKENEAQKEIERTAQARVDAVKMRIPQEDTTIQVVTDIFNSHIQSIDSKRLEIEADESIVGADAKHQALAKWMEARYLHLVEVIQPKLQSELKDTSNEIRTIQSYYNNFAKKLHEDFRAQIRIKDVQYHPPEKPVKKPKAPTVKKFDKKEIREASGISGIPENILTMICVQRNISVREAIQIFKQAQTEVKGE